MTMNDLERDLKALAEPEEDDERLRLALRAKLVGQLQPARAPRPRRDARRRLYGAAAAAAAAVATAVTLVGTSGSGGPASANAAIIHHALRAVTPPGGAILHVKVVNVQNGTQFTGEWWQRTSPPYAFRGMKGSSGHMGESADDGTTTFTYDPGTNTIYEQPDTSAPMFLDPVSQVQAQLAKGGAHVAGTTTIGGETLYEIDLPQGVIAYFDVSTYAPRYVDDPQRDGSVVRLQVVTYEHLATTSANLELLSLTAQHPDARIDRNPSDGPASSGK